MSSLPRAHEDAPLPDWIQPSELEHMALATDVEPTVFVTHDLAFLLGHGDRLIWLDAGRIVLDGPPAGVAAAHRRGAGQPGET